MPIYPMYLVLYLAAIAYGLVPYLLGELIIFPVLAIGFGLPIFAFIAIHYAAAPIVACVVGYFARWSGWSSCLLGYPLVVLVSAVAPMGNTERSLPVPVPWLAAYKTASSHAAFVDSMQNRLPYYTVIFVVFLLIGLAHGAYLRRRGARP